MGHEKTLTGLLPALAGANLIYGLGMLDMGITFSFGQVVIDNEFARMIKHAVKGIPVDDETLAVDIIKEVGPFGDFLSHDQTFKYMRLHSQSKLIDRTMRHDWEASGRVGMYAKAAEEARRVLADHKPDPLPDNILTKLRSIVQETEEELCLCKNGA